MAGVCETLSETRDSAPLFAPTLTSYSLLWHTALVCDIWHVVLYLVVDYLISYEHRNTSQRFFRSHKCDNVGIINMNNNVSDILEVWPPPPLTQIKDCRSHASQSHAKMNNGVKWLALLPALTFSLRAFILLCFSVLQIRPKDLDAEVQDVSKELN